MGVGPCGDWERRLSVGVRCGYWTWVSRLGEGAVVVRAAHLGALHNVTSHLCELIRRFGDLVPRGVAQTGRGAAQTRRLGARLGNEGGSASLGLFG